MLLHNLVCKILCRMKYQIFLGYRKYQLLTRTLFEGLGVPKVKYQQGSSSIMCLTRKATFILVQVCLHLPMPACLGCCRILSVWERAWVLWNYNAGEALLYCNHLPLHRIETLTSHTKRGCCNHQGKPCLHWSSEGWEQLGCYEFMKIMLSSFA